MTNPTPHGQVPEAFLKSVIALCSHRGYSPANIEVWDKDDKWIADLWRQAESMLTTSPTPPAPQPAPAPLSAREIELLDGMIDAQLNHAQRCDSIPNRPMAEKQKGWDMERVTLLRKLKATMGGQQA